MVGAGDIKMFKDKLLTLQEQTASGFIALLDPAAERNFL